MQITSGKIEGAQKVLVYGPEGIGKSTFAAAFPDPLFIDTEGSTKHMNVKRLPTPESWTMLMEEVTYVLLNPDVCRTLVIDTVDWAEQLCVAHVCAKAQKDGIEDFGYGKGYTYLAEEFGHLLNRLTEVVDKGVNVVLCGHASIRKFEQPDEMAAYDRWELKLGKKTAPLVKEWVDAILFANYKTIVVKSEGTKTAKGQGGHRVIYTTHAAAWDAKNRHDLPDELSFKPAEYAAIAERIVGKTPAAKAQKAKVTPSTAEVERVLTEELGVTIVRDPVPEPVQEALDHVNGTRVDPAGDQPAHIKQLAQLMKSGYASDEDVRKAVAEQGYFPLSTPIEKYPADFVEGVLIAAWPKVLEVINSAKIADAPIA